MSSHRFALELPSNLVARIRMRPVAIYNDWDFRCNVSERRTYMR